MFKDTPESQTHYYGDGCKPPHRCQEGTCKRAYNNVCLTCNLDMPDTTKKCCVRCAQSVCPRGNTIFVEICTDSACECHRVLCEGHTKSILDAEGERFEEYVEENSILWNMSANDQASIKSFLRESNRRVLMEAIQKVKDAESQYEHEVHGLTGVEGFTTAISKVESELIRMANE